MPTLADRLARIDTALNCHRFCRYLAITAGHDGEALAHEDEIDRLVALRTHVEAKQWASDQRAAEAWPAT